MLPPSELSPSGENLQPHVKGPRPRGQGPPAGRKQKTACDAFRVAHETLCGKPSGTSLFEIEVCYDPSKWFYQANQTSTVKQGPKTPREILNPDCPAIYKNQILLTNLHVKACIGWHWAEDSFIDKPWEETLSNWREERMIALGAEEIPAPDPADKAWKLTCALYLGKYTAIQVTRHCLALGAHRIITEHADGLKLIDHIRQKSIERMHGPKIPLITGEVLENALSQVRDFQNQFFR